MQVYIVVEYKNSKFKPNRICEAKHATWQISNTEKYALQVFIFHSFELKFTWNVTWSSLWWDLFEKNKVYLTP